MASVREQLAANQRMFRDANERLSALADGSTADGRVVPFLCECADGACFGRLEVTLEDYFIGHLGSDQYVVLAGHLRVSGEELVEDHGFYEVVSKAAA